MGKPGAGGASQTSTGILAGHRAGGIDTGLELWAVTQFGGFKSMKLNKVMFRESITEREDKHQG